RKRLELNAQRTHDDALLPRCGQARLTRDLTKVGVVLRAVIVVVLERCVGIRCARIAKVEQVKRIQHVSPEFHAITFLDRKGLGNGQVDVLEYGSPEDSRRSVAEAVRG